MREPKDLSGEDIPQYWSARLCIKTLERSEWFDDKTKLELIEEYNQKIQAILGRPFTLYEKISKFLGI